MESKKIGTIMKLHKDRDDFIAAIIESANYYSLGEHIIEKDYWITLMLKRLTQFEYSQHIVFKGGTSLSKGFGLIHRFSEDVDIALRPEAFAENGIHKKTGEAIHKLIKKLKIEEFKDVDEGKESEKYRYKRVYEFPKLVDYPNLSPIHDRVILEVNAFSNPTPTENVEINSLIAAFIGKQYGAEEQNNFELQPFTITALSPERSFCEKLLAIRRASHKGGEFFSARLRHIYDIFQLYESDRIKKFTVSPDFEIMLNICHNDDTLNKKISTEISPDFNHSELFSNPEKTLRSFETPYNNLKSVTFDGRLPNLTAIVNSLQLIGLRLKNFIF
jgi:predicted nucleotidyltransferase component of viral defense system